MSEIAFTVGIMSLIDALFGMRMETILTQITVSAEIRDALLFRTGFYGEILQLAEWTEQADKTSAQLNALLTSLQMSADEFYAVETQAFEWGNNISSNLGHVPPEAADQELLLKSDDNSDVEPGTLSSTASPAG
jgi:EAL and modified HD-GYP domain-containing signal transduction protein